MRSLNLDQLRTLQAVVETGSFTAAAKLLNLSQPAVSTQIRELEERFGVRLLERLGRKAFPTSAGREVVARGQRLADEAAALETAAKRHREGFLGPLRLGVGAQILVHLLPPILKSLRETQPTLEVVIRSGIADEIRQRVVQNELDLALVTGPIEDAGLTAEPILSVPLLAVLPERAPRVPAALAPRDFADRTLILMDNRSRIDAMVREWLRAGGVDPRPAMELDNPDAIRNLVAAGLGVSILPPEVAAAPVPAGALMTRPLVPPLIQETVLIQRRDKPDTPALRIMREALAALSQRAGTPRRRRR
jgi:DNA-binding transcriptional LysR family regulator